MKHNPESVLNVLGLTRYLDDLPEPAGLLHGAPVVSRSARGRLTGFDASAALALDPGVRIVLAKDVPGQNQLGVAVQDEPAIAAEGWGYRGQVLALALAPSRNLARRAAALVKIQGEDLPPVVDAREAAAAGDLILKPMTMRAGDPEAALASCALLVEGRVDSAGQEHVYLETQGAMVEPLEGGRFRVVSGTQSPSGVQVAVARVLGLPMNAIEVEAPRLGGAFGGKEDQAAPWAALAAIGSRVTGRPVKIYLNRRDDMLCTGKRHPYSSDYRVGLDAKGRIVAFEADYYQNSGECADLSPAILSRTLFHANGAYRIPNVRITGRMCRTNLPPFTAFRGFGAPQGIFVVECAIEACARAIGVDPAELKARNLLSEGDEFHYGMPVAECRTGRCLDLALRKSGYTERRAEIKARNASNALEKRGIAILPLCFGVSFTKLMLNQGGALVHVYADGSVSVNTGAVEMGQGVNRKLACIASKALGIPLDRVRVERTRTALVANTVATAASTGADINGMALLAACESIASRLSSFASSEGGPGAGTPWNELVARAHQARIDLSAHGFYATPGLSWNDATAKGSPFAYHVYGCAVVEASVDIARGRYRVERATIVHDAGDPIDELVDMGQAEGAFAQGLGWSLLEDLAFSGDGRLLSDTLSTYKLPDARFLPARLSIEFLKGAPNAKAVFNSKAIGEPPFMYGMAGYFAVLDALLAARPSGGTGFYDLPMTPEKALSFILGKGGGATEPRVLMRDPSIREAFR